MIKIIKLPTICLINFIFSCSSSWAESQHIISWKKIFTQYDGEDYIDPSQTKRDKNGVYLTSLVNFFSPIDGPNGPIGSIIAIDKYYCKDKLYDTYEIKYFSGPMATGKDYGVQNIQYRAKTINLNSPAEAKYNYACDVKSKSKKDNSFKELFNASGYLMRSVAVCNIDVTKTAETAARLISSTPELQTFNKTEQAKQWGIDGAKRFNLDREQLGSQAACDNDHKIMKELNYGAPTEK